MKKRILAVLMATSILWGVVGCGSNNQGSASNSDLSSATGESAEDANLDLAEKAIADRKASGEYPTITVAFLSFTGPSDGADRVNQLISEYTEETYGIKTEILNYDLGNYSQQLQLAFASNEPVDLFSALAIGYSNSINLGYTLDLEENDLLQTYGQGIIETVGEDNIETCRIGGVLSGIPNMKEFANGIGGIFIPKQYLDTIGYDYEAAIAEQGTDKFVLEDTIFADYDLIDELFEQLHEAYPDKYVFGPQTAIEHVCEVDAIGGDVFGVLFSDSTDLQLENMFENDHWLEYLRHVYQWNQNGYISKDALTDSTDINTKVSTGEILTFLSNTKPAQTLTYPELGEMIVFMLGDYFSASNAINNMPWCIGANCEDPVAAMQLLNAFYTDPVLENLICWGEEGTDYVVNEDGTLAAPEGHTLSDVEYKLGVSWEMPNQFLTYIKEDDPSDVWEQYDEMNNAAKKSIAAGFIFDNSSVQNEYIALTNVWAEYQSQLMLGFVDPDVVTAELVERLNAAGYDTYVAEKQRQLDEWAAAN